jgi:hypothetical protein
MGEKKENDYKSMKINSRMRKRQRDRETEIEREK